MNSGLNFANYRRRHTICAAIAKTSCAGWQAAEDWQPRRSPRRSALPSPASSRSPPRPVMRPCSCEPPLRCSSLQHAGLRGALPCQVVTLAGLPGAGARRASAAQPQIRIRTLPLSRHRCRGQIVRPPRCLPRRAAAAATQPRGGRRRLCKRAFFAEFRGKIWLCF